MKHFYTAILCCFVFVCVAEDKIAHDVERPPTSIVIEQANHIDPLVAVPGDPFYPSRIKTDNKELKASMFSDSMECSGCHKEIYEQWQNSAMSLSWKDPIYKAILKRASEATEGKTDNFCIGCHSPIGLTTDNAPIDEDNYIADRGVDCAACHSISNIHGIGNAAFTLSPMMFGRKIMIANRKDAVSPYHDTAYSDKHTKSDFCATCHNVTHPFNKLAIERTYDEWRDSIYNTNGVLCQDCHMPRTAGKSAEMGKDRMDIASHHFPGANATLLKHFGKDTSSAENMLKSAASLEFIESPKNLNPGNSYAVTVRVNNVGAGHKLPTGFPEGREVWVDFKVLDADGVEVYRLGKVMNGHTEPGTKSFKAILGDKNGDVVDINVWEADRILADTRILPNSYRDVIFMFDISKDVRAPLSLHADLNYWPFPQSIVDELLGEESIDVSITKMTSISQ